MIAAPLKQDVVAQLRAAEGGFPRSDDRGPIEACNGRRVCIPSTDFRDQMIAAPLKRRAFGVRPLGSTDFRDQMIAAPLKPACGSWAAALSSSFPRSDDRGPIEAMSWRRGTSARPHISAIR